MKSVTQTVEWQSKDRSEVNAKFVVDNSMQTTAQQHAMRMVMKIVLIAWNRVCSNSRICLYLISTKDYVRA